MKRQWIHSPENWHPQTGLGETQCTSKPTELVVFIVGENHTWTL